MKKNLTQQELNELRDNLCSAMIYNDSEAKQYYLEQMVNIVFKNPTDFFNSAEAQGYILQKGIKPK
jgi:hypothetical protein